jgi:hypothetical protein
MRSSALEFKSGAELKPPHDAIDAALESAQLAQLLDVNPMQVRNVLLDGTQPHAEPLHVIAAHVDTSPNVAELPKNDVRAGRRPCHGSTSPGEEISVCGDRKQEQ